VKCTVHTRFRPSATTSRWLPGKWRHFRVTSAHLRSRDVTSCYLTASSCELPRCKKWNVQYTPVFGLYSHFQMSSGQMTSLPGHFPSPEVTWRHFLSHNCLLLRGTALQEVKSTVYGSFWPSTGTSRWLSVKWRHFRVTSGHLKSRDVISCNVTASSCELQACRRWNVHYTPVFGLLQPLPGDFRSNDVTSRSLPLTWGHMTSLSVTSLPPPASFSLVENGMYSTRQFSVFSSHFEVSSGQMTSLPGHFLSFEDTWRHFLWRECLLLRATTL